MDFEKRARLQSFRVIISEIIMVIAVILTVVALAFIVSGYWLGSDFTVERQGMLQIYSIPTGATVAVDGGTSWFQRTNTSKVLSSGEHEIILTKDGYDSWSKTVNIRDGLLYRLSYPRLFLQNRTKETIYDAAATTLATVSPNRKLMLLADRTTRWILLNLDSDHPAPIYTDISALFTSVSLASGATSGLFTGEILSTEWDHANEHLLIHASTEGVSEWVLLNVKNPTRSVNLTREFATDFNDIKIFDDSASQLLAVRNRNLHKIDVSTRQISAVLVEDVENYDFYESELVFVSGHKVYTSQVGDNEPILLMKDVGSAAKVLIGKFYNDNYIFVIDDDNITVLQQDDEEPIFNSSLTFVPSNVKLGYDNSFVAMSTGTAFATLDLEAMGIREWTIDSPSYGWAETYMLYAVDNGRLFVYDFDGLNRRELASNVSSRFPVAITSNKWLYYFSDDTIMREQINN